MGDYFKIQLGLAGKYRTLKWKFLTRERSEEWRMRFYPTRGYRIIEIIEGRLMKATARKLKGVFRPAIIHTDGQVELLARPVPHFGIRAKTFEYRDDAVTFAQRVVDCRIKPGDVR